MMARTYGESMVDFERHEEESGWKKRLYNLLKSINEDDDLDYDTYMSKLEVLVAEGIDEDYDFPNISNQNLTNAVKRYIKHISS